MSAFPVGVLEWLMFALEYSDTRFSKKFVLTSNEIMSVEWVSDVIDFLVTERQKQTVSELNGPAHDV